MGDWGETVTTCFHLDSKEPHIPTVKKSESTISAVILLVAAIAALRKWALSRMLRHPFGDGIMWGVENDHLTRRGIG